MQWFKKKSTKIQSTVEEVPLVDQPLQMPDKSNEELLTELQELTRLRLKTKWVPTALFVLFIIVTASSIFYVMRLNNQSYPTYSDNANFVRGMAHRQEKINQGYIPYYLAYAFYICIPLTGYLRSRHNCRRISRLVEELIRRKETGLLPAISELLKTGSGSLFDPNHKLWMQAILELLPFITRDAFEFMSRESQYCIISLLNHCDRETRVRTRHLIIVNGSVKTLSLLREYRNAHKLAAPSVLNPIHLIGAISHKLNMQVRKIDKETFEDLRLSYESCITGLEERFLEEWNLSQLLRPSSANSDGSELLRATQGGVSNFETEDLLRPNAPGFSEARTSEIAANYQPSPHLNPHATSENQPRK